MRIKLLLLVTMIVSVVVVGSANAQTRRQTSQVRMGQAQHKVELNVFGGYRFTFSRRVCVGLECGNADLKDSGFWALEMDINVQPYTQLILLYDRQDTQITFDPDFKAKRTIGDAAVEYWHIGGLRGVPQGKVMPFGSFTLGATRINYKNSTLSDDWRFSMILGGGAKIYASERVGLRLQARLPYTFTSTYWGVGCGGGGCGTTVGGYGVAQFDLSGGLMLLF